jgi:hypothetical protein
MNGLLGFFLEKSLHCLLVNDHFPAGGHLNLLGQDLDNQNHHENNGQKREDDKREKDLVLYGAPFYEEITAKGGKSSHVTSKMCGMKTVFQGDFRGYPLN